MPIALGADHAEVRGEQHVSHADISSCKQARCHARQAFKQILTSIPQLSYDNSAPRPSREQESSFEDSEDGESLRIFKYASWDDLHAE